MNSRRRLAGGPRLTASPGQRAAADWAIARLKRWGIDSARSEPWGRFGRSWQLKILGSHRGACTGLAEQERACRRAGRCPDRFRSTGRCPAAVTRTHNAYLAMHDYGRTAMARRQWRQASRDDWG